jgi:hypothetical protein
VIGVMGAIVYDPSELTPIRPMREA